MTKLRHFDDSAAAVSRSRALGAQSVAVHERGQAAIREARKLLEEINGTVFGEEGESA